MKASIILADAVSANPDGTFSLLRGGIDRVRIPNGQPCVFRGGIVTRVTASTSEIGAHDFKIMCVDDDGVSVMPPLSGKFNIKEAGGAVLAASLQMTFPKPGRYSFSVTINKQELDTQLLSVKHVPSV